MAHVVHQSRNAVLRKHLALAHDRGPRDSLAENLELHDALHIVERLHLDKREPEQPLWLVVYEAKRGAGLLRMRTCPHRRLRLHAAIAKDKSARIVREERVGWRYGPAESEWICARCAIKARRDRR